MPMAHDVEDFVDDWIVHNIEEDPALLKYGTDVRPVQYAENCLAAVVEAGFRQADIEGVFGDFEGYIATAIDVCTMQNHEVEHLVLVVP